MPAAKVSFVALDPTGAQVRGEVEDRLDEQVVHEQVEIPHLRARGSGRAQSERPRRARARARALAPPVSDARARRLDCVAQRALSVVEVVIELGRAQHREFTLLGAGAPSSALCRVVAAARAATAATRRTPPPLARSLKRVAERAQAAEGDGGAARRAADDGAVPAPLERRKRRKLMPRGVAATLSKESARSS